MKKTILLAAALLPGALLAQNQPTKPIVEVYASGGGNHNRGCTGGGGRCIGDNITRSEKESNVIIRKSGENQIEFSIHKDDFSEEELEMTLKEMVFVISKDSHIKIEESILNELDIKTNLVFVSAGNYPMRFNNDRFEIILLLSEK